MVMKKRFKEFSEYKNNDFLKLNEARINELVELTKHEYPTFDNYLIWMCAVDFYDKRIKN